jgi:hypothetical protein
MRRWPVLLLLAACTDAGVGAGDIEPDAMIDAAVDQTLSDATPEDAGVDATPDVAIPDAAPDMPVVDAAPPFDPCAAPDRLVDVAQPDGDGFIFEDITRDDDGGTGTCGGPGADRILEFTAPRAGVWRIGMRGVIPGIEPVLHARRTCADPQTELACRDNVAGSSDIFVHLDLQQDETVYLFADADNRRGGFFELTAQPVPIVEDACDPLGMNVCADGECRDGACVPTTVPVIDGAEAARLPNGQLAMRLWGRDAGADAEGFLLRPAIRNFGFNPFSRLGLRDLPGQAQWDLRLRVNVPGYYRLAHRLQLTAYDAQENLSAPFDVSIPDAVVLPRGAKCGPIDQVCPSGQVCQNSACTAPSRPVVLEARAVFNPVTPAVWVQAVVPPAADVRRVRVELLPEAGRAIDDVTAAPDLAYTLQDRRTLEVSRRLTVPTPEAAAQVRITAIGVTNWRSEPVTIPIEIAPERAEGEACDPLKALDICPADTVCDAGVCVPIVTECPADWNPLPVEGPGPVWRVRSNLQDPVISTRLSCGGSGNARAFTFTAPEDGEYLFTAYSGELSNDPVLTVRSQCPYGGRLHPEFELACDDDSLRRGARVRLELTAGQTVYPIVDGHGRWRGEFYFLVQRRQ